MLTSKKRSKHLRWKKIYVKKALQEVCIFNFPSVMGLDDISNRLNVIKAENPFVALMHVYNLSPIENDKNIQTAERLLEYLERAFEKGMPKEVANYQHILLLLIEEYNNKHYVRANEHPPHKFLKILLEEDKVTQQSLVPDCFRSRSQVSEFLSQKKGRQKLSYEQALSLGKRFNVDPLNFL
jgi:antitoxin component HigA of HigAB toxin-antitoxin module